MTLTPSQTSRVMAAQPIAPELELIGKCNAAIELYVFIMDKVKDQLETKFGKPTTYYGEEKKTVVNAASAVYTAVVTPQLIEQLRSNQSVRDALTIEEIDFTPKTNSGASVDYIHPGWDGDLD